MPPPVGPATPAAILAAVASAGRPWAPAAYAADTGTDRDALYDPVTTLVRAGLLAVADWQKGTGQTYRITDAGAAVAADAAAVAKLLAAPHAETPVPPAREPLGPTTFDRGELARTALLRPRPPVVVPALLMANVVWFLVGLYYAHAAGNAANYLRYGDAPVLHRLGGVTGSDLLHNESWRLLTACFAHSGGLHLLLNMYALGAVGAAAERVWGLWRFAVIYAIAGLAGNCLAMALGPATLVVGASGAILGITAALAGWLLINREFIPPDLFVDWGRSLLISGLVCAGVSLAPRVSWEAHAGGAAAGFAAAVLANAVRPGLARKRVVVPAAALLGFLPVACLLALTWVMETSTPWAGVTAREAARAEVGVRAAAGPILGPINPSAVESAYTDVLIQGGRGKARVRAGVLAEKAAAAAAAVRAVPAEPLAEPARAALAAYADRVRVLAEGLMEPNPDWEKLLELKKAALAAWK